MIKKYLQYISEANEDDDFKGVKSLDKDKYTEIITFVKEMVDKTIESSGGEKESFIDSLVKNPDDVKVEGFINDSDIYEFYLKWRNDVDEILNNIGFYDKSPIDENAFGLYDYLIKGTEKAFSEVVKMIK